MSQTQKKKRTSQLRRQTATQAVSRVRDRDQIPSLSYNAPWNNARWFSLDRFFSTELGVTDDIELSAEDHQIVPEPTMSDGHGSSQHQKSESESSRWHSLMDSISNSLGISAPERDTQHIQMTANSPEHTEANACSPEVTGAGESLENQSFDTFLDKAFRLLSSTKSTTELPAKKSPSHCITVPQTAQTDSSTSMTTTRTTSTIWHTMYDVVSNSLHAVFESSEDDIIATSTTSVTETTTIEKPAATVYEIWHAVHTIPDDHVESEDGLYEVLLPTMWAGTVYAETMLTHTAYAPRYTTVTVETEETRTETSTVYRTAIVEADATKTTDAANLQPTIAQFPAVKSTRSNKQYHGRPHKLPIYKFYPSPDERVINGRIVRGPESDHFESSYRVGLDKPFMLLTLALLLYICCSIIIRVYKIRTTRKPRARPARPFVPAYFEDVSDEDDRPSTSTQHTGSNPFLSSQPSTPIELIHQSATTNTQPTQLHENSTPPFHPRLRSSRRHNPDDLPCTAITDLYWRYYNICWDRMCVYTERSVVGQWEAFSYMMRMVPEDELGFPPSYKAAYQDMCFRRMRTDFKKHREQRIADLREDNGRRTRWAPGTSSQPWLVRGRT